MQRWNPIGNRAAKAKSRQVLLCVVLLACSHVLAQAAPSLAPIPGGVEISSGSSKLDIQLVEDELVRVYVRPQGESTPRTLVLDPDFRPPAYVHRAAANGTYLLSAPGVLVRVRETSPYEITILDRTGRMIARDEAPFRDAADEAGVTLAHAKGETFYGIHGLPLNDEGVGLTRDHGGRVYAGVQGESGGPFLFTAHYGFLVDSDGGNFTTTPNSVTFSHDSRPDIEYFVLVGPPLKTMAALSRLVGPPPMPPKWTLGFLNSQWGSNESEVEQIIATYRKKQIPIDGFIFDFDWKAWGEDNYGEWRWNSTSGPGNVAPDKFPDGASGLFARQMAAQGVKLAGILKPRILLTVAGDPNKPTMAAAYATAHHFWYPAEVPVPDYFSHRMARNLDFNNAAERKWFWAHLLPSFQTGMTAWWNDEADFSSTTIFNNFQFLNMGRMLYDGQRADSKLRVWSINRAFYLGASRYGYAGWSGDIKTGFASMAYQRLRMLAALDTGEFQWSMDTGGFIGHPTPENYARWMEFAAFVPIMRAHGDFNEKRQPWVYGPIAEAAATHAIDLRYQFLPYIYSYARLSTEGDVGLVRPLFWEFPSDPKAATQDSEWMFGDGLLVAPVVTQGATSKQIYLPKGNWFDYANGTRYTGAQTIHIPIDATTWKDIPLFVRSGSILATQPVEQYVGQHPITEITLDVFPAKIEAAFTAYDDDGDSYDYEKGRYLQQGITAIRKGAETLVKLNSATGSYASPLRVYLFRIHTDAHHVALNGKSLAKVSATELPPGPSANWAADRDRFGPVILLRVTAAFKTPIQISLR